MVRHIQPGRWSPGYTLDDAALIRRTLIAHEQPEACPRCGSTLSARVGRDRALSVWMVRCDGCAMAIVVVRDHAEADA